MEYLNLAFNVVGLTYRILQIVTILHTYYQNRQFTKEYTKCFDIEMKFSFKMKKMANN